MVEAVRHFGGRAPGHIGHRTTGDEPHHQLDALAARFAHVVDVRHFRASGRVVDELVKPGVVPFAVDEACACALQLVAHAPGAPDVHVQVFVKALHRAADGLPQLEAAAATGHGVLHHVHRKRNHRAGPGTGLRMLLAAHQRQRHRQAVVHIHLVDDGEVKVLLDHALRNVAGQLGVALHHGHGARAPAFIGRLVLRCSADGERGNQVQAEGRGVVVVDEEDDIGLVVLHPLPGEVVAREQRLPVVFLGLAQVHGRANGGHVRCVNGCGNACHGVQSFWACPALPCGWRCAWASPSSPM